MDTHREPLLTDGASRGAWSAARAGILDRLVSALLRENLLDPSGCGASGLRLPVRQVNSAGRLAVDGPIVSRTGPCGDEPITDPIRLLEELARLGLLPRDGLDWERAGTEIAASVQGYAMALDGAARRADALRTGGGWDGARPFTALVERLPPGAVLAGFEQMAVDGHPLHPMARSRIGMSVDDVRRYAPEFGAEFRLPLVALATAAASGADGRDGADPSDTAAGPLAVQQVLAAAFPAAVAAGRAELAASGDDPGRYALLPIHPHQLDHAVPALHPDALSDRRVVPLSAALPARSLMSTRTLAVGEPGSRARLHVKTALEVQITSAVRGVSFPAAHNGPRLSRLLLDIAEHDPLVEGLALSRELAAACLVPPETPGPADAARRRSVGVILREDPETLLEPGEVALPAAALLARSPLTGRPVIDDLITELANGTSRARAAARWLRRYLELIVPPALTLLTRYGIAMEAHPQNTVLVLRDAMPHRAMVRDLGGIGILEPRLGHQGYAVDLVPDSELYVPDPAMLRAHLCFALFVHHLGELVPAVAAAGGRPERTLWGLVRGVAQDSFRRIAHGARDERSLADADALLRSPWPLKPLLRMRLTGRQLGWRPVAAPNPVRPGGPAPRAAGRRR
ncbi:IucA/IucC family protein [Actinomadura rubrisoli]|uniref:IucA/IucC family siderophore biosynthesis protein n=1 Tax=Actinomadura rubrisoli TaxID=2530368 RepID=A0A4R5C6D8_9ACTN|nr:IucA/IucC family protein [Actinomadura rubrisoli]TDD94249.1 IucA/IucC family siderophore biosynthesis protein [Actinomadura rubrisoli]